MTSKIWPHVRYLAALALALACGACQHAGEPRPKDTAAPKQAADGAAAGGDRDRPAAVTGAHDVGTPGPAMALNTIDGDTIDLAKLYGTKPVYLKFWATWCVPCREQMPKFKRIYDAVGDRIQVIAVNIGFNDDEAAIRAFREEYGLRMPIVIDDGRLAAALDLQVTVQHVLMGRDARIAYRDHRDGDELDVALQKVMAEAGPVGPARGRQPEAIRAAFRTGEVVQPVDARAIDGSLVPLGRSHDGRPRALVFFSTWSESYLETSRPERSQACRRVREEVEQLAASGGVEWLGIAGGPWADLEDVIDYKAKSHTRIPLALDADGALFRAFGVRQVPTVALLDPAGRLVRLLGPDDRDLAQAVRSLQAQK